MARCRKMLFARRRINRNSILCHRRRLITDAVAQQRPVVMTLSALASQGLHHVVTTAACIFFAILRSCSEAVSGGGQATTRNDDHGLGVAHEGAGVGRLGRAQTALDSSLATVGRLAVVGEPAVLAVSAIPLIRGSTPHSTFGRCFRPRATRGNGKRDRAVDVEFGLRCYAK